MSNRLDDLLARLAGDPLDRSLINLEVDVQQAIRRQRTGVSGVAMFAPLRAATVAVALMMGITVGGMTAATAMAAPRASVISGGEELAPSTLLEGR